VREFRFFVKTLKRGLNSENSSYYESLGRGLVGVLQLHGRGKKRGSSLYPKG